MKTINFIALFLLTFLTLATAHAEVTASSQKVWGVIYDSNDKPIAGIKGKLCLTVPFSNGEAVTTCDTITADNYGQIWISPLIKIWSGNQFPTRAHESSFQVHGIKVTGSALAFDPICNSESKGYGASAYLDTTCVQHTNIEFKMPFDSQCKGRFEIDAIGRLICTKR